MKKYSLAIIATISYLCAFLPQSYGKKGQSFDDCFAGCKSDADNREAAIANQYNLDSDLAHNADTACLEKAATTLIALDIGCGIVCAGTAWIPGLQVSCIVCYAGANAKGAADTASCLIQLNADLNAADMKQQNAFNNSDNALQKCGDDCGA